MRIAMLTYSVKPRGGVVHALEVSEALAAARPRGRADGARRARARACSGRRALPVRIVHHVPIDAPFDERIEAMLAAYTEGLRPLLAGGRYDIVHAQDCLSANAALALRDEGVIEHVIRTVHHVDEFTSPSLIECQDRSIIAPDHVLCVSQPWVDRLRAEFGVSAGLVSNGVDTHRFRPPRDAAERADARRRAGRRGPPGRADRRRRRAAQGLADAARGLRAPARRAALPRPGAADRGRHDAVRLPPRGRPLRGPRGRARPHAPRAPARRARAGRDRAPVPRRGRVRVPVGQGGLRAGGAGGAGRRRAARGLRHRRLPRLPDRRRERAAAPGRRRRRAGGRARARRARARAAAAAAPRRRGGRGGFGWDASGAAHEAAYERVGSVTR